MDENAGPPPLPGAPEQPNAPAPAAAPAEPAPVAAEAPDHSPAVQGGASAPAGAPAAQAATGGQAAAPAPAAPAPPAPNGNGAGGDGDHAGGAGGDGAAGGGGNANGGGGPPAISIQSLGVNPVGSAPVVVRTPPATPITVGKTLTSWVLLIAAGSILLLIVYLWRMDVTAGDDIRRNYGKDLNREDISLYLTQRLRNFSDALSQSGDNPAFAVPKKTAEDESALIETLNLFPSVLNNQDRATLDGCVALMSVPGGADRKAKLDPCARILDTVRTQGVAAASAAFSYQLAAEASQKLLDQRNSLHDFWLKAAQLILLNLLLPVLTAVIGYTFGNQQAQQDRQQQEQQ